MSGSSMGTVGVNRVAKEKLNVNNPYVHHWSTSGGQTSCKGYVVALATMLCSAAATVAAC